MNKRLQVASVALGVLLGSVAAANAALYTASLADDFSLASNSNTDTWSYRLAAYNEPIVSRFDYLLPTNTRTAIDVWGTAVPSPPTMWSDATGYWAIGKNTSGVTQSAGSLAWPDGAVLMHPDGIGDGTNADPSRIVVSWLAPSAMTIDVTWSFSMAPNLTSPTDGNGVGLEVDSVLGGVGTTEVPFSGASQTGLVGPINGSLLGLTVAAGDRLYWSLDTWGDPSGDITLGAINIVEIPEPSSIILLSLGAAAMVGRIRTRRAKRAGQFVA